MNTVALSKALRRVLVPSKKGFDTIPSNPYKSVIRDMQVSVCVCVCVCMSGVCECMYVSVYMCVYVCVCIEGLCLHTRTDAGECLSVFGARVIALWDWGVLGH